MTAGDAPGVVEGREGISGFLTLYTEAFDTLRRSAHLRLSLGGWSLLGLAATVASCVEVAHLHGGGETWSAAAAVVWWALVVAVLLGGVPLLHTPDGARIEYLGVPNGLTAIRAWACLPLLLVATRSLPGDDQIAIWCIGGGIAGMLDAVDGAIARSVGPLTELGRALDPAMDALFFSVGALGSMLVGIIPWWVMALVVVRYLGPLLASPVVLLRGKRPELSHTVWGRRNTALVGAVIFACMWVRLFHGPASAVATVLAVLVLVPTTALHFVSLWQRTAAAPVVRAARFRR